MEQVILSLILFCQNYQSISKPAETACKVQLVDCYMKNKNNQHIGDPKDECIENYVKEHKVN